MAVTHTRPLLIATSVIALLAGCEQFGAKLATYGEAGSAPDYYRVGDAAPGTAENRRTTYAQPP